MTKILIGNKFSKRSKKGTEFFRKRDNLITYGKLIGNIKKDENNNLLLTLKCIYDIDGTKLKKPKKITFIIKNENEKKEEFISEIV